jgi:Glycosyltransferase family 87
MRRLDPNLGLAIAAVFTVAVEAVTRSQARYGPECLVTAAALALAWRRRERLRPDAVIALAVALPTLVGVVHLAKHVDGDGDLQLVYAPQGQSLLDGRYPHSEYPPGAVLVFALEQAIRTPRAVNPFAMALCQGLVAWCLSRLQCGAWLAAGVALWPVNAYFWEFKYDALPTALLALGLMLALRERWTFAGAAFGLGAAVKWTPAIACVLLVLWLLSLRRPREARAHAAAAAGAFALVVVPFLAWSPSAVWASVAKQAPRGLTAESIWYLPLRAVGEATPLAVPEAAIVPDWADTVAVVLQLALVASLAVLLVVRRPRLPVAVAIAACGPALFLLLNKVFSAQYILTVVTALAVAPLLVGRRLAIATLLGIAAAANVFVYPIGRFWQEASAVLFASALAACLLVVYSALTDSRYPQPP